MDKKYLLKYSSVWVVNSLILYYAGVLYPESVVLGNAKFAPWMAAAFSGLLLTAICRVAKYFAKMSTKKSLNRYSMFAYYFLVNSFGLWVIARMAPLSGLGLVSYYWAFSLGLVLTLSQWVVRQLLKAAK